MNKKIIKKRKEHFIIREANNLVSASYRFNVWEDRIFLLTLAQIMPDDEDFKEYYIHIRDLNNDYGIKTNRVYDLIREAVISLRKKTITIPHTFNNGKKGKLTTGLFTSYGELDDENRSYIVVELHPKLKPYLLQLREKYTQYNIQHLINIKSAHSRRIYKLLKQYQTIGHRTFELEDLKQTLCIAEDEYKRYYDFKKRLILKAQKDLEVHTDLKFEFEEFRYGNKVQSIKFYIYENENQEIKSFLEEKQTPPPSKTKKTTKKKVEKSKSNLLHEKENNQVEEDVNILSAEEQQLFSIISDWGITLKTYTTYISKYGVSHVKRTIEYTLKKEDVKDKAAYFIYMIGLDWKDPKDSQRKLQELKLQQKQKQNKLQQLEKVVKEKMKVLKTQEHQEMCDVVLGLLKNQSFSEEELLSFAEKHANKLLYKEYDQSKSLQENYELYKFVRYAVNIGVEKEQPSIFQPIKDLYSKQAQSLKTWFEEQRET